MPDARGCSQTRRRWRLREVETTGGGADSADAELLARLRAGDEAAFRDLVVRWSPAMLRVARTFVGSLASAEDAVQDTWLGVVNGLHRFESRSSLRSWTFAILVNRARTRGAREARTVPAQLGTGVAEHGPTVDPARFQGPDGAYPGHWTSSGAPRRWSDHPEDHALSREAVGVVETALEQLPPRQKLVVSLRDVHGFSSEEVCSVLKISPENQRVLLHRGRAALRQALEEYFRP